MALHEPAALLHSGSITGAGAWQQQQTTRLPFVTVGPLSCSASSCQTQRGASARTHSVAGECLGLGARDPGPHLPRDLELSKWRFCLKCSRVTRRQTLALDACLNSRERVFLADLKGHDGLVRVRFQELSRERNQNKLHVAF